MLSNRTRNKLRFMKAGMRVAGIIALSLFAVAFAAPIVDDTIIPEDDLVLMTDDARDGVHFGFLKKHAENTHKALTDVGKDIAQGVSKVADTVHEKAIKPAGKALTDTGKAIAAGTKTAVDDTSKQLKDIRNSLASGADSAVHATHKAAVATHKAAVNAGSDIVSGAKTAVDETSKTFNDFGNDVVSTSKDLAQGASKAIDAAHNAAEAARSTIHEGAADVVDQTHKAAEAAGNAFKTGASDVVDAGQKMAEKAGKDIAGGLKSFKKQGQKIAGEAVSHVVEATKEGQKQGQKVLHHLAANVKQVKKTVVNGLKAGKGLIDATHKVLHQDVKRVEESAQQLAKDKYLASVQKDVEVAKAKIQEKAAKAHQLVVKAVEAAKLKALKLKQAAEIIEAKKDEKVKFLKHALAAVVEKHVEDMKKMAQVGTHAVASGEKEPIFYYDKVKQFDESTSGLKARANELLAKHETDQSKSKMYHEDALAGLGQFKHNTKESEARREYDLTLQEEEKVRFGREKEQKNAEMQARELHAEARAAAIEEKAAAQAKAAALEATASHRIRLLRKNEASFYDRECKSEIECFGKDHKCHEVGAQGPYFAKDLVSCTDDMPDEDGSPDVLPDMDKNAAEQKGDIAEVSNSNDKQTQRIVTGLRNQKDEASKQLENQAEKVIAGSAGEGKLQGQKNRKASHRKSS